MDALNNPQSPRASFAMNHDYSSVFVKFNILDFHAQQFTGPQAPPLICLLIWLCPRRELSSHTLASRMKNTKGPLLDEVPEFTD